MCAAWCWCAPAARSSRAPTSANSRARPRKQEYRALFAELEALPVPVVAAMHGTVLGGGLEIALACHYRVAVPGTRFGLARSHAGHHSRRRRHAAPAAAHRRRNGARDDARAHARSTRKGARARLPRCARSKATCAPATIAYAQALVAEGRGPRRTARARGGSGERDARDHRAPDRAGAASQYPNRSAALTAIEAVVAVGCGCRSSEGLRVRDRAGQSKPRRRSSRKALVHVFFAERETRKVPGLPRRRDARGRSRSAGIVGAGTMGGGIAICFANAGIPVTLIDASREALDRGLAAIAKTYESMVKRGRITAADKAKRDGADRGCARLRRCRRRRRDHRGGVREPGPEEEDLRARSTQVAKPGAMLGHQHLDARYRRDRRGRRSGRRT